MHRPSRWQIEHDIEAIASYDEWAAKQVAEENKRAMLHKPLVFNDDEYPPIASEHDREEDKW